LAQFDAASSAVVVDLKALLATTNVEVDAHSTWPPCRDTNIAICQVCTDIAPVVEEINCVTLRTIRGRILPYDRRSCQSSLLY
jgi:hypothetical protein